MRVVLAGTNHDVALGNRTGSHNCQSGCCQKQLTDHKDDYTIRFKGLLWTTGTVLDFIDLASMIPDDDIYPPRQILPPDLILDTTKILITPAAVS